MAPLTRRVFAAAIRREADSWVRTARGDDLNRIQQAIGALNALRTPAVLIEDEPLVKWLASEELAAHARWDEVFHGAGKDPGG